MTGRKAIKILWVEDSLEDMEICLYYIEKAGYAPFVTRVETAKGFREKLDSGDWDIILCDYHLPGFSGPEALEILSTSGLDIPLVIVTGAVGEEAAVKTLLNGADNYVLKDNLLRLGTAIEQTLEKKDLIREKRAAESALDGSVKRMLAQGRFYEKILDSTSAFLVIINTKGRIVNWNKTAERLSGYNAAEIRDVAEMKKRLFPNPDDGRRIGRWISQVIEEKMRLSNLQTTITCRDGSSKPIAFTANYMKEGDGAFEGAVCIGVDLSKYRKLEAQFRKAQKMEAVGVLAGGIAHDFNNILAAIMGNIEMLMMEAEKTKGRDQRLRNMYEMADRGADLVKRLMDFSRSRESSVQIMDLVPLAKDIVKLAQSALPSSITIKVNIQADLWPVRADPVHLHQVGMNLVVNAGQAMPHGGALNISCENVDLNHEFAEAHPGARPGRYVRFSVLDTGCGMDAETLERIFDPFFTTKEMDRGTGLGLSTAYGIIKSCGGFISVKSSPGQGASFHIYLPASPSKEGAMEASPASLEVPASGSETVLLVDDEEIVRDIFYSLLKKLGYEVVTAKDGIEALKIIRERGGSIDLVLTDMAMPKMYGGDLLRKIIGCYPHMPIIAMSGLADHGNAEEALGAGAKAFLAKPCPLGDLAAAVRKALDSPG